MGETKMGDAGDRMDRAGRYVLGLMNDEERERAERDLEIDPAFRDAMVEIAERMHVFDRMPSPGREPEDHWRLIKEKIDAMPQMRAAPAYESRPPEPSPLESAPHGPPVTFGRRRSDRLRTELVKEKPTGTVGTGLHSVSSNRALMLALCLIAAFALGYVAGVTSGGWPPAAITAP